MLVASTAVSLIAPFSALASDYNIEGMNSYGRSKSSSKNKKKFSSKLFSDDLATFEKKVENPEASQFAAGSFSETTTMDGKVIFTLGSVETEDDTYTGEVTSAYTYQMNLNTSFDGDDNLYVRIKSGNHLGYSKTKSKYNTYLKAGAGFGDYIDVDKIWYTKPITDNATVFIGPRVENYYMHATTPSIYKGVLKAFALGGNGAAYGASTSPGAGFKYEFPSGFAFSSNFASQGGNGSNGMLTDQSPTSWATQIGYTQPQYSASFIVNIKSNDWYDEYFQSTRGFERTFNDAGSVNYGLRAWWRPEETGTAIPSISLGYDVSETDQDTDPNALVGYTGDETTAYFVGLNWQDTFTPDDRIGIAFGQPQKHESDPVDPFLYEVYYDYKLNDSITITPAFFGGTYNNGGVEEDMTGYVINTTYKF